MTFEEMKTIEPTLAELERHAHHAGRNGADWWSVLQATHEPLSKIAGRGAHDERLISAEAYERARHGLFEAWQRGQAEAEPCEQTTFLDVSEVYR